MKQKVKVVGITRGVNKAGRPYTALQVNKPLQDAQIQSGGVGVVATSYFVGDDILPKVNNDIIGKDIMITTFYAGNRDNLISID